MRASRLLHLLLLLQNRGRMTTGVLARELEVARRTVLRDVDALTEAGLPVVVVRGPRGGIELGFNYRTRLTGLDRDEAEAIGVLLAQPLDRLAALGLGSAAERARRKLLESFPDAVRAHATTAAVRFRFAEPPAETDPRVPALAAAVREERVVRIRAHGPHERVVHPAALERRADGWFLFDGLANEPIALDECGDVNISSRRFMDGTHAARR
ncbi:MAG: HTH domain-containing protein [Vicinamibacterales bacterium]